MCIGPQTFTDLAEMVAKIRGPTNRKTVSDSESELEPESEPDTEDDLCAPFKDKEIMDGIENFRRRTGSTSRYVKREFSDAI